MSFKIFQGYIIFYRTNYPLKLNFNLVQVQTSLPSVLYKTWLCSEKPSIGLIYLLKIYFGIVCVQIVTCIDRVRYFVTKIIE